MHPLAVAVLLLTTAGHAAALQSAPVRELDSTDHAVDPHLRSVATDMGLESELQIAGRSSEVVRYAG